jgi:CRP-like cAMP-binding protein
MHRCRVAVRDVPNALLLPDLGDHKVRLKPDPGMLHERLERYGELPESARTAVNRIPMTLKAMEAGSYIVREADAPNVCAILRSGFAYRQKVTGQGKRQILAVCVPGEIVDLENLYLDLADHSVQMLTEGEVLTFPRSALQDVAEIERSIARAILVQTAVNASVLREWLTNVGQRGAKARIAHLLCELGSRLAVGELEGVVEYELPMNQEHLGDALGLTAVHLNRKLRQLADEQLVTWTKKSIHVHNWKGLRDCGDFNSRYLHLDQVERGRQS